MEMASSQVEIASSSTFGCVLRDQNQKEKCIQENNNVRAVQAVFEKNLKVLVRDHLNNNCCGASTDDAQYDNSSKVDEKIVNHNHSNTKNRDIQECSLKSPVLDRWSNARTEETDKQSQDSQISSDFNQYLPSSPNGFGPYQNCHPGQPANTSRNETLGASSLVQIWEARLHNPSHPSASQSSNIRTSSELGVAENSCPESLSEDIAKESDVTQPVDEANNNYETDCESQSDKISVSDLGEKERERVRVVDIIRRLSNDPETSNNNINNNGIVDNNEETQRCFLHACSPRIRGRQAFAELLMQMERDRQKELVWLSERHAVSKFTHRGRLQSMLKIRCLERCTAIQDRGRSKSAVSETNRLPKGSSVMHLREKFKTNSENSCAAWAEAVVNQNNSSSTSSRVHEDLEASRGDKTEAYTTQQHKAVAIQENVRETNCLSSQESEKKILLQKATEKSNLSEIQETVSTMEVAKNAIFRETEDNKTGLKKPVKKMVQQETRDTCRQQETATRAAGCATNLEKGILSETAGKSVLRETADENISMGIVEKTNLQKLEVKAKGRGTMERINVKKPEEKCKTECTASCQITEKKVNLAETTRESNNLEAAESSDPREVVEKITSRQTENQGESNAQTRSDNLAGKVSIKKADSREMEGEHRSERVLLANCLHKSVGEEINEREEEEQEETRRNAEEKRASPDDVETGGEATVSQNLDDEMRAKEMEENETKKKQEREELRGNSEKSTTSCLQVITSEAVEFPMGWDEEEEEEEEYDENNYNYDDWINEISRPRSYWEDLRKQWYLEVLNTDSAKLEIRELLQRRTVSSFLSSDLRETIDRLMISRVQRRVIVESNSDKQLLDNQDREEDNKQEQEQEQESRVEENSETVQDEQEQNKEQYNQCSEATLSESFSRSSSTVLTPNLMISWSFRDREAGYDDQDLVTSSHPAPSPSDQSQQSSLPANHHTSSEMQLICDLRGQMVQLQHEMIELRNSIRSCIDMQLHFQNSVNQNTRSVANEAGDMKNPLKRKCCVCHEMPVDSLLYRCGHICTCLKCGHELQWNSKKCPICLAPIIDVVRAFLDC